MDFLYDELYLTEKDTQAQELSPILGCTHTRDWWPCYSSDNSKVIVPLQGHISNLIFPAEYDEAYKKWNEDTILCFPNEFKRKPAKGKEAIYNRAISHIRKAKKIIIATDFDAEGAAMAMSIIKAADAEDRIEYMLHMGSMQEKALRKALKEKPYIDYKSLAKAGLNRAELDWAEGMSYSRAITLHLAKNRVKLNFGGLLTPIINMVVQRDLQFENPKENKFFILEGRAKFNDQEFKVSFFKKTEEVDNKNKKKIVNNKEFQKKEALDKIVEKIKENNSFNISSYSRKNTNENPEQFFTQSSLQIVAGEKLNLEPVQVLALSQDGYLKDKTNSYPRTEIPYIAASEYDDVPDILKSISKVYFSEHIEEILSKKIPKRANVFDLKEKEVTSHGAIIPTLSDFDKVIPKLSPVKQKFFEIIAKRYVENFMPPAISEVTKGEIHLFDDIYASFYESAPKEAGFKILGNPNYNETIKNHARSLPEDIAIGSTVQLGAFNIIEKKTKPKPRFTLTSLVSALEKVAKLYPDDAIIQEVLKDIGIGTGATRAPTIDGLFLVKNEGEEPWFIKKGKQVISTPKARKLMEILPEELTSPIKRAFFQKDLKLLESGEITEEEIKIKYKNQISENIALIKEYGKDPKNIFLAKKKEIVPLGLCPICKQGEIYEGNNKKVYLCSAAAWKNEGSKEAPKWKNEGCDYTIFKSSVEKLGKKTIGILEVKNLLKNGHVVVKLKSAKTGNEYKKNLIIDEKWGAKVDFNSNPK